MKTFGAVVFGVVCGLAVLMLALQLGFFGVLARASSAGGGYPHSGIQGLVGRQVVCEFQGGYGNQYTVLAADPQYGALLLKPRADPKFGQDPTEWRPIAQMQSIRELPGGSR